MSRNYFNLDEVEIDNILMINLFPKRKGRLNFSDRESFETLILPEIKKLDAESEYVENLIKIHSIKKGPNKEVVKDAAFYYDVIFSCPKYLKLAVVITLDSLKE